MSDFCLQIHFIALRVLTLINVLDATLANSVKEQYKSGKQMTKAWVAINKRRWNICWIK